MSRRKILVLASVILAMAVLAWGVGPGWAQPPEVTKKPEVTNKVIDKKLLDAQKKDAAARARALGMKPGVAGLALLPPDALVSPCGRQSPGGLILYLSIFFYGIVAWSIPSIMAAAVGDCVGARMAGRAFGFITFIFGLGQIIGPAVAGVLAEQTGSFSSSFYMAAVLAGVAILLTSFLKSPVIAGRS